jgi:hypothetical protein
MSYVLNSFNMSSFPFIVRLNIFRPESHKFNFNGCNSSFVFCFNRPGKVSKFRSRLVHNTVSRSSSHRE